MVSLGEPTAEHRLNTERLEHAVGHGAQPRLLGVADPGYGHSAVCEESEVLEGPVFVAIGEVEIRRQPERAGIQTGRDVPQAHELVRLRVRQRLEQHGVDDTEDRGVRADSEREREHGRERERGPAQQPAKRIAKIASHGICETDRARRPALTLGVLELVHVVTPPENLTRDA
jgi:hypothetical protein